MSDCKHLEFLGGRCGDCDKSYIDVINSLQARIAELESDVVERDAIWLPEKDARIERLEEMIKNRDAALKEIDETMNSLLKRQGWVK